jgi:hypothetical protein
VIHSGRQFLFTPGRGARKLMGGNLKPVWAEFSTISYCCYDDAYVVMYADAHPYL